MHIKRHSIIILFFLFLFSPLQILASEEPIPTLYDGINLEEENITAQNLGVDEQNILPGDTLYLFKNIWRRFKTAITFDKIKKAELKLQHANERIIEAQNLVDGGVAAEAEK